MPSQHGVHCYLRAGPFVLELLHFDRPDNPAPRSRVFNEPGLTHLSVSIEDIDAEEVARRAMAIAAGICALSCGNRSRMCSTVKNRGGVCFAYAATRVPAGALPGNAQTFAGPQFARRK